MKRTALRILEAVLLVIVIVSAVFIWLALRLAAAESRIEYVIPSDIPEAPLR